MVAADQPTNNEKNEREKSGTGDYQNFVRERERDREGERGRWRQTNMQTDRQTDRQYEMHDVAVYIYCKKWKGAR